jgi:hypothetical protein
MKELRIKENVSKGVWLPDQPKDISDSATFSSACPVKDKFTSGTPFGLLL